jgi:Fe-S cluster biogenesis protein NfuA
MSISFERVEKELENIRPYLLADGGDLELVEITESNIVKIKVKGNCERCPLLPMTLRAGIERSLIVAIPEVKRVEAVNM